MNTWNNTVKMLSRSTLALGLAAIGGLAIPGLATEAQASVRQIDCPQSQIRSEVVTPMRRGWWSTPQVRSLQDTRVADIGGRTALLCDYGAAGVIQRYAPRGRHCEARNGGFYCSTAPAVHRSGTLGIKQTQTVDLDYGQIGKRSSADLWLQAPNRHRRFLVPRNGAEIAVGDFNPRGYEGCSNAYFRGERVALRHIPVGAYVCVKTSGGRISEFRMDDKSRGPGVKRIRIEYTTWQQR